MDITPLIPKSRQTINGYGNGGFKINNERVEGSVIIFPDHTQPWNGQLSLTEFQPLLNAEPPIELLLIGTGTHMAMINPAIQHALRAKHIAVEAMDTGAACRTYNILMAEERRVAAALIQV